MAYGFQFADAFGKIVDLTAITWMPYANFVISNLNGAITYNFPELTGDSIFGQLTSSTLFLGTLNIRVLGVSLTITSVGSSYFNGSLAVYRRGLIL